MVCHAGLVDIYVAADLEAVRLHSLNAIRDRARTGHQEGGVARERSRPEDGVVAVAEGDDPDGLEANASDGAVVGAVSNVAAECRSRRPSLPPSSKRRPKCSLCCRCRP